jgi:hypothetical protein
MKKASDCAQSEAWVNRVVLACIFYKRVTSPGCVVWQWFCGTSDNNR